MTYHALKKREIIQINPNGKIRLIPIKRCRVEDTDDYDKWIDDMKAGLEEEQKKEKKKYKEYVKKRIDEIVAEAINL